MEYHVFESYSIYMYYPLPTTGKVEDENFDFFLEYAGNKYLGTAFSIKNIVFLMGKENNNFFCLSQAICLIDISLDNLKSAIDKLIKDNEIEIFLTLQSEN